MIRVIPQFRRLAPLLLTVLVILPTRADAPRRDVPAESRWVRKLPSGVTVELLGMSDPEAKPSLWWTPDGKLIATPINNVGGISRSKGDDQVRHFAVRVEGPSNDELDPIWDFGQYSGGRSGTGEKDGEPVRGVDFAVVALPRDAASWTIRLVVAAGRWVTDATRTSDGRVQSRIEGRSVIFTKPRAIERGTAIVVAEDYPDQRDVKVVAFNRDGRQRSSSLPGRGWEAKAFRVHDATLIGIKPYQVDRYELQSRPIETVEFRDVPLAAPKR
jgi:hypothetical protein